MNTVGQTEDHTQERLIAFFQKTLGYTYRGNLKDKPDNTNIIEPLLTNWLQRQNNDPDSITKALHQLQRDARIGGNRSLYEANRKVYEHLRYGINVAGNIGEHRTTVKLIDWQHPHNNDFSIAEEVTLQRQGSKHTKRPDLVLYINGIAIAVIELKRSTVSVSEGIRQNLNNQNPEFIQWFFSTVQLLMAGNETQGLRYSVIETPEKYWLRWKETEAHPDAGDNILHREIRQLCSKERLLEILHDFLIFDASTKKICRHNQFFGVKAAQEKIKRREGGILWHTQGSGKSLTMVWLAKWTLENNPNARILIITDRTELDDQIENVFAGVNENITRIKSGADLIANLHQTSERLLCSLVHKFGASADENADIDHYAAELQQNAPHGLQDIGEFFIFVDECHRTHSGKLHAAMKTLLPNAVLIGFTGTPLLKSDKQRSIETFGPYIHTYKYDEAVQDNVVLDLRYEARDIDQDMSSEEKIDQWFESKTRGLTDTAKALLKQRWGTMQRLLSSKERLEEIVADIVFDMGTRDRLQNGRGNALLVADSIYSACRFYTLLQNTELNGKCAIITSYRPTTDTITTEETGHGLTERQQEYNTYRDMLATHFNEPEDRAMHKTDIFEQEVKYQFINAPERMKLLIVVDKLLTGFDAPPATYLYIDKHMQDHGLFQAICRVNRLHGEDKEYGYIVDYKDLFRSLEAAITDYTGEAFENYDPQDVSGLLKDRLQQGKERLDTALEQVKALCEPVEPPQDTPAYIRYFCSTEPGNADQLRANEQKRLNLYKLAAALLRAYANLANEMHATGYTDTEAEDIKAQVTHYENVRQEIKLASGDYVDLKVYEPDMRHLLDTYITAEGSVTLSTFDEMPLLQLIIENPEAAIDALPEGIRNNQDAVAATVENNFRRVIVDKTDINPKHYEKMSKLLEDLVRQRRRGAIDYQEHLATIAAMSQQIHDPDTHGTYPSTIDTPGQRALYDNLPELPEDRKVTIALALDQTIRNARPDDWRGHIFRERIVRRAIAKCIQTEFPDDTLDIEAIFELVRNRDDY